MQDGSAITKENETELLQKAQARSQIYNLLALLFSHEPDQTFLTNLKENDLLQLFAEVGFPMDQALRDQPEEQMVEEMAQEYTRLFIGPGHAISPHESVYREGEGGRLWGPSTAEVKAFIESLGLTYPPDFKGIPDHISVEMDFMHRLVNAEAEARESGDSHNLHLAMEVQKRFFTEHLNQWIPQFVEKVAESAKMDFYKKIALFTKEFMSTEEQAFS